MGIIISLIMILWCLIAFYLAYLQYRLFKDGIVNMTGRIPRRVLKEHLIKSNNELHKGKIKWCLKIQRLHLVLFYIIVVLFIINLRDAIIHRG
jgi:hypothetical protein